LVPVTLQGLNNELNLFWNFKKSIEEKKGDNIEKNKVSIGIRTFNLCSKPLRH
jgi:hypothetical protein